VAGGDREDGLLLTVEEVVKLLSVGILESPSLILSTAREN
jgi:hypothetical protein